jgi:hypothetical protein
VKKSWSLAPSALEALLDPCNAAAIPAISLVTVRHIPRVAPELQYLMYIRIEN